VGIPKWTTINNKVLWEKDREILSSPQVEENSFISNTLSYADFLSVRNLGFS
jgi:hypothetical protein